MLSKLWSIVGLLMVFAVVFPGVASAVWPSTCNSCQFQGAWCVKPGTGANLYTCIPASSADQYCYGEGIGDYTYPISAANCPVGCTCARHEAKTSSAACSPATNNDCIYVKLCGAPPPTATPILTQPPTATPPPGATATPILPTQPPIYNTCPPDINPQFRIAYNPPCPVTGSNSNCDKGWNVDHNATIGALPGTGIQAFEFNVFNDVGQSRTDGSFSLRAPDGSVVASGRHSSSFDPRSVPTPYGYGAPYRLDFTYDATGTICAKGSITIDAPPPPPTPTPTLVPPPLLSASATVRCVPSGDYSLVTKIEYQPQSTDHLIDQRGLINWAGANSAFRRGYFQWVRLNSMIGNTGIACTCLNNNTCLPAAGFARKVPVASYGSNYVELVSCKSWSNPGSIALNQRANHYVEFVFGPTALWLAQGPLTNNDVSVWAQRQNGQTIGWSNSDVNFGLICSVPSPTPTSTATPTPTPIPNQCQQITILRNNSQITAAQVSRGDLLVFRGRASGASVTYIRFTVIKGGVAQAPVDVPVVTVGGDHTADLQVGPIENTSYSVEIQPVTQ